ncbi:hypothetical protein ACH5RR_038453 [Cinchona calisaya]|uniref:KIB1-4 beta-propeller domain-containing protein n=1 Tax=Cinchona calisaya TaxID=153742 RepID=A0ABD2Y0S2_9GENT
MGNWSHLFLDPLEIIARKLKKIEDFTFFRSACTSWKKVASKDNFMGLCVWQNMPYLMLPLKNENQNDREFYSLLKKKIVAKVNLPQAKGKICFESKGWFLTMGELGDMSLLNPFSPCGEIFLPHRTTMPDYRWHETDPDKFIQKMVLSSDSSDFVIMVIFGCCGSLSYWKFGEKSWRNIETNRANHIRDLTFYDGKFFAINSDGNIYGFDVLGPNPTEVELITQIPEKGGQLYIMESSGNLLVISWPGVQLILDEGSHSYTSMNSTFELFEVDLVRKTWKEIKNLGGNSAFIGYSSSILVEASKFHGLKANHIYYAGHGLSTIDGPKLVCIYNLEDDSMESLDVHVASTRSVPPFSRSFWVKPNF